MMTYLCAAVWPLRPLHANLGRRLILQHNPLWAGKCLQKRTPIAVKEFTPDQSRKRGMDILCLSTPRRFAAEQSGSCETAACCQ
jgi:hypothetical protein